MTRRVVVVTAAAGYRAAAVRPLLAEPHHRLLHPDRRGDRRDRRRGHDRQGQLAQRMPEAGPVKNVAAEKDVG